MFLPEAAVALVGVEAAAWIRAWGGIRIVARGGLLDSSRKGKIFVKSPQFLFECYSTFSQ